MKTKPPKPISKIACNVDICSLYTALRCYFELNKKHKPALGQPYTKLMLKLIAEKRFFFAENANEPFLDVYLDCLNTYHIPVSVTQKKHQLNAREWYNITAHYTNKLTRAICQDLEAGKLDLLPYQLTRREKYLQQLAQIKEFKQRLKDG